MSEDFNTFERSILHVAWLLLTMVVLPIVLSWYMDYGHWLRTLFDNNPRIEQPHPAQEK